MESNLVLDTNIFLQCRKLDELPWPLICASEIIVLIPAPTALDEIDKLKFDGNKRRARRAREVTALFRRVLLADPQVLEWRVGPSLIQLKFAPPLGRADELRIEQLPRPDHRIIEEAIALRQVLGHVTFCSDDTGAALRAMRRGLNFILAPEEWRLSETDPLEKQNSELKDELAKERLKAPKLECSLANEPNGRLHIQLPSYATVNGEAVAEQTVRLCEARLNTARQAVTEADILFEQAVDKFSQNPGLAINARQETVARERARREHVGRSLHAARQWLQRVERWSSDVERTLSTLPEVMNSIARIVYVTVDVANRGTRPATDARLLIRAHGGVRLLNQAAVDNVLGAAVEQTPMSRSPKAGLSCPSGRDGFPMTPLERMRGVSRYSRMARSEGIDHEWHLRKDVKNDEVEPVLIFECADFRHSDKPTSLGFAIELLHQGQDRGAIEVELTATNASLSSQKFPLSVTTSEAAIDVAWGAVLAEIEERGVTSAFEG